MKILFLTTTKKDSQGDLLEVAIIYGLRKILGKNCIDFPRKKIMYHDWSDVDRKNLHGNGFNVLKFPLEDITEQERAEIQDVDVVLYGCGWIYEDAEEETKKLNWVREKFGDIPVWYLDSNDLFGPGKKKIGNLKFPSFKREIEEKSFQIEPTGLAIPEGCIITEKQLENNLHSKDQLFQSTAPNYSLFKPENDLGNRNGHKFTDEDLYNQDIQRSWFGLACIRGGWDSLRIYEIIANGALLMYRDYENKPFWCSPQELPTISYSTEEQLYAIMNRMVIDGKPTEEYRDLLKRQREWLFQNGTCEARAKKILETLEDFLG